jgi:glutamate-ammonia-ligase adenylyltransferase
VRLIAALQQHGFFSEQQAKQLTQAYCTLRDYGHKRVLQGDKALIDEQELLELREQVAQLWQNIMA